MKINKLIEEITNFDNIKDPKTVLDPVTGDAIETSKKAQDNFDKVAKPFDKPITGSKEDEKSPAQDLDESFDTDGWELEGSDLCQVLDKLVAIKYEIDNCVRGSYATNGADTYTDLARYLIELADDLIDCANDLADEEAFDDDMDESLNEKFEWTNGELKDFDPQELMDKVKARQMSLFTLREFNNKLYDISIHPHGRVDEPEDIWVDVVEEDANGNQERVLLQKYQTYDEAIQAMQQWKDQTLETPVDVQVEEDLNEDGRQNREKLTPEQKAEEKAMAATLFDRVYNELEKDTDGSKNKVNKKASQRYTYDDLSTDINGNIVVYAPTKEKLQNAVNVAAAYELEYKIDLGSSRNKNHAFRCTIIIPEEE